MAFEENDRALEIAMSGIISREKEKPEEPIVIPTEKEYLLRAFENLIKAYLSNLDKNMPSPTFGSLG